MSTQNKTATIYEIRTTAVEAGEQTRRINTAIARRAYEIFEQRGGMGWHELEDWRTAETELRSRSCFGLTSSEDALLVGCSIAGFKMDSLEVWVDSRQITISGTPIHGRKPSPAAHPYPGPVFRVIELPVEIEPSRAFATIRQHYFLEVHLPIAKQEKLVRACAA